MSIKKRRRSTLVWITIVAIFVGLGAGLLSFITSGEQINRYFVVAELDSDGDASILESITYDFGRNTRRGIVRDVSGLSLDDFASVESATAPDEVSVAANSSGINIRIGNPDITITGQHQYDIRYDLNLGSDDQFSWNAIGTDWEVDIEQIEVHILSEVELESPQCFVGRFGSQQACDLANPDPGHLVVEIDRLDAGEGITIDAQFGDPVASVPTVETPAPLGEPFSVSPILSALVSGLSVLFAGLAITPALRRLGR